MSAGAARGQKRAALHASLRSYVVVGLAGASAWGSRRRTQGPDGPQSAAMITVKVAAATAVQTSGSRRAIDEGSQHPLPGAALEDQPRQRSDKLGPTAFTLLDLRPQHR
jgi:hypothetical protein